jgi:anion-transporting  ArsA/GET3 family ATPase
VTALGPLPRVVFVLGKGGVGRSTIATALGTALARRGKRILVFEWALAEAIAPWFGLPAAGIDPCEIAPMLWAANFRLDDSLRAYFVDHLRMGAFYRHVIDGRAVRRLVRAAPGIAEMMFLGHICWLTTLAESEAGLRFDHVLVDAPATGHGAALLDLPATLAPMQAAGMLGAELARVDQMMRDPRWTGAIAVALPEELAVEETLALVPRAAASLGRPLLAVIVNRSATGLVTDDAEPAWLPALRSHVPPPIAAAIEGVQSDLRGRLRFEQQLRKRLAGTTRGGIVALEDRLARAVDDSPRAIVAALATTLDAELGGAA